MADLPDVSQKGSQVQITALYVSLNLKNYVCNLFSKCWEMSNNLSANSLLFYVGAETIPPASGLIFGLLSNYCWLAMYFCGNIWLDSGGAEASVGAKTNHPWPKRSRRTPTIAHGLRPGDRDAGGEWVLVRGSREVLR